MRVAMVGPFGFHPNKTMRSRALPLAEALSGDHQLKVFMPPWQTPEQADRTWQEGGVEIRYVALGGGVPVVTGRLLREVISWKPDVVHVFKPKAYSGLVGWWIWRFYRRRFRLVIDTDDWEGSGGWNDRAPYTTLQKKFFGWQEDWGLTHNHAVTVASQTLQSLVWAKGVPADQVYYLPNGSGIEGINKEGANQREQLGLVDRPVLLLYSRLFEFDIDRLISILSRVHSSLPNLAVLAVGISLYSEDADVLRNRIEEAGLADTVFDLGWIEEKDLPGVLSSADLGLYLMDDTLLNRTKCPVKLADMLSMGVPVVAEDVGQVPEYVKHGQTGLLYKSGDTVALAAGVIEILTNENERKALSYAAAAHIKERFNWRHLANIAIEAYGLDLQPN